MLGNGKNAWLKLVSASDNAIHGGINPNGAVTGRATHSKPNVAQTPSVEVKEEKQTDGSILKTILCGEEGSWGADCRELFTAKPGWQLVGADLSKLELLCLAHFLARYDGGKYTEVVLSADPHVYMQNAARVDTRYKGKTLNYALVYGGGDLKLGHTADPMLPEKAKILRGRQIRSTIMRNFTGLKELTEVVKLRADKGFLYGLDGRFVKIRHKHAALNTLLQSAGALIAKQWIREFVKLMDSAGMVHTKDWFLHAWVHDEMQFSVPPALVGMAEVLAIDAAAAAGEYFNLRVPILAEAKHGNNWKETH
jgi:DNA polymerase I-like protein with 3'-5' exonuclease and polymerase domains